MSDTYNLKEANKHFIAIAAFLARDMGYDHEQSLTEKQVDKWRDYTMQIISQHKSAHKQIQSLRVQVEKLTRIPEPGESQEDK